MIHIRKKEDCCGCNACGDICPKGAIGYQTDHEGFLYPVVDPALCVDCGLCEKVCPQLQPPPRPTAQFPRSSPRAGIHRNLETRFASTSGGLFSALAEVFYKRGGFVAGAVWDDDFAIRQIVSDRPDDLPRLRKSKYAQSDSRGFFQAVRAAVKTGRPVLVCGTPCQMAALRLFLGQPADNLLVVDFICRGLASPLVLKRHLEWLGEEKGSPVAAVHFMNKELGWRKPTTKYRHADGSVTYEPGYESPFLRGFLKANLFCRPTCYQCRFKSLPRCADLTLADCWGCQEILGEAFDRDLGTSLVLANNPTGEKWLEAIGDSVLLKEVPWEPVLQGNPMLERSLPPPVGDRDRFFRTLEKEGYRGVLRDLEVAIPPRNALRSWLNRCAILALRFRLWPWNIARWARCLRVNGLRAVLAARALVIPEAGVRVENEGDLIVRETHSHWGRGRFAHPPLQTRVRIEKGARLVLEGECNLVYGGQIEIFPGAELTFGGGNELNVGTTIVCGESIRIGRGTVTGRNVTIRDTNGGHWINHPGYRNTAPVVIGDHVWLCEGCNILPGVTIGSGAIIAARAVVTRDVPANTLVAGNPARVIRENVEWKP